MKLSLGTLALWLLPVALGQTVPECTAAMVASDDCAAVIDANACYNEFRFSGTQTLACIAGKDEKDRGRKVRRRPHPSYLRDGVLSHVVESANKILV